jgi:hypothetical protein
MSFLGTLVWITGADDLLRHRKLYVKFKPDEIHLNWADKVKAQKTEP